MPPHIIYTVDNVIDIPNIVHDNKDNDVLAHIDPDRCINGNSNCNYYTIKIIEENFQYSKPFDFSH